MNIANISDNASAIRDINTQGILNDRQSDTDPMASKLSAMGLRIQTFEGNQVNRLSESQLVQIAHCYMEVFNESWGESWDEVSALREVKNSLQVETGRTPIASLLYRGNKLIGFAWGVLLDKDSLAAERDMPFGLHHREKQKGLRIAQYWLDNIAKQKKLFLWRELGVLKSHRKLMAPFLGISAFKQAMKLGYNTTLFWTNIDSAAFNWGLGVGLTPVHFFIKKNLLLMFGSISYTVSILEKMLSNESSSEKRYYEFFGNINRYSCKNYGKSLHRNTG